MCPSLPAIDENKTPGQFVQMNTSSRLALSFPVGYRVQENGCWDWVGAVHTNGYGLFWNNKKLRRAHRVFYEMTRGPIPKGLVIDHLCRNKLCVNPDHLEAVTQKENLSRGGGPIPAYARRTHCHRGHALTPDNRYRSDPSRRCRACHRIAAGLAKE